MGYTASKTKCSRILSYMSFIHHVDSSRLFDWTKTKLIFFVGCMFFSQIASATFFGDRSFAEGLLINNFKRAEFSIFTAYSAIDRLSLSYNYVVFGNVVRSSTGETTVELL